VKRSTKLKEMAIRTMLATISIKTMPVSLPKKYRILMMATRGTLMNFIEGILLLLIVTRTI